MEKNQKRNEIKKQSQDQETKHNETKNEIFQ
jgi:hypothetical protein